MRDFLCARFPQPFLRLSAKSQRQFVLSLADAGIVGGAVYDALIAATVADCGGELATCDRRALPIYDRFGIPIVEV